MQDCFCFIAGLIDGSEDIIRDIDLFLRDGVHLHQIRLIPVKEFLDGLDLGEHLSANCSISGLDLL